LNILSGGEKLDPRGQMEKSSKLKKRYVILGLIGSLIVRLIWITNKKTFIGFQDYWSKTADGNGVLVTFWHNQGLLMPLAWKGLRGRSRIIVSRSKDGDLIAGLLRIFGILCVRGSSTRGGKEALSDILIAGSDPGMTLVVTPDGPKGPAGIVKEGVSYLALKTGRPLYCLSVSYTRVHMFKSWDGFLLPWPFGRSFFVCRGPIFLSGGVDKFARKRVGEQIQWHLDRVNEYSRALSLGHVDIRTVEKRLQEICPFDESVVVSGGADLPDS
jgi:hypothetical protein